MPVSFPDLPSPPPLGHRLLYLFDVLSMCLDFLSICFDFLVDMLRFLVDVLRSVVGVQSLIAVRVLQKWSRSFGTSLPIGSRRALTCCWNCGAHHGRAAAFGYVNECLIKRRVVYSPSTGWPPEGNSRSRLCVTWYMLWPWPEAGIARLAAPTSVS